MTDDAPLGRLGDEPVLGGPGDDDIGADVPDPRGERLALASLLTGIIALAARGLGVVVGPVAIVLGVLAIRIRGMSARPVAGIMLGSLGILGSGVVALYLLGL